MKLEVCIFNERVEKVSKKYKVSREQSKLEYGTFTSIIMW